MLNAPDASHGPRVEIGKGCRRLRLGDCLDEVSVGVGETWANYRLVGATREGLAPAKEKIGKRPERYKLVEPRTIFYNPMRILLGSIAMIDDGEASGITSPDYVVVRPRKGILNHRWFYYWLRSPDGAVFIKSLARGAVRERMLFNRLAAGEISLPTWDAQERFAQQIDSVARLKAAVAARRDALSAARSAAIDQAYAHFDGASASVCVREICESIDYGHTASAEKTGEGPRFLRITDIQEGKVNWAGVPRCRIDEVQEQQYRLAHRDIVFARTGATTGKSFLILDPPRAVFASYLIRLRASESVHPHFLYFFFQSVSYWRQVRLASRGGAQPNVNATLLGNIRLRLPSREAQTKIVAHIESILTGFDSARAALDDQLRALSWLPAALLRSALHGKL